MAHPCQSQINELLLEREELFVRIHLAEKRAAELLGEPYPFERPSLPSDPKAKRKPLPSRAKAAGPAKQLHLPPLGAGQAAYRITYEQWDRVQEEVHDNAAALTLLLSCQTAGLKVLRIEVLDTSGAVASLAYQA